MGLLSPGHEFLSMPLTFTQDLIARLLRLYRDVRSQLLDCFGGLLRLFAEDLGQARAT